MVFLDLDMIVMRNIDELFELRPPAGMSTVPCSDKTRATCFAALQFKSEKSNMVQIHGQRLDPRPNEFRKEKTKSFGPFGPGSAM